MEPVDRFVWCLSLLRAFLKFIHQDLFQPNFPYGLQYVISVGLYLFLSINYIYTVSYRHLGTTKQMLCFAYFAVTIQVWDFYSPHPHFNMNASELNLQCFVKFAFLRRMRSLIEILQYIESVYRKNSGKTDRYHALCQRFATINQWIMKGTIIGYVFIGTTITLPTTVEYFLTGRVTPSIYCYWIGVDEYTTASMIALNVYNYSMLTVGFFTHVPVDSMVFMAFASFPFLSQIIQAQTEDLAKQLKDNNSDSSVAGMRITKQWIHIIEMNHKYIE